MKPTFPPSAPPFLPGTQPHAIDYAPIKTHFMVDDNSPRETMTHAELRALRNAYQRLHHNQPNQMISPSYGTDCKQDTEPRDPSPATKDTDDIFHTHTEHSATRGLTSSQLHPNQPPLKT